MKTALIRTFIVLAAIEIFYLVLVNTALNLQVTQDLINKIKPDKFSVSWDSAWTLYPARVYASGVSANGQSRGQQWQASAPEASASISLLQLPFKIISLSSVSAADVTYHQRPRPREDKDFSAIREYFPPIDGRELETEPVAATVKIKKQKKPWDIRLEDMHATGNHKIWLYQVQAALSGDLHADLSVQTRGGPLSISNGRLDVELKSLMLNGDREVSREGHIKGELELLPFKPKENKGLKSLAFLNVDVDINTETESLAFLNIYLNAFQGMKLDGSGIVDGRVILVKGDLSPGTDLKITAHELGMDVLNYRVEGDGMVTVAVPQGSLDNHIGIQFDTLEAFDVEAGSTLFTGNGLAVNAVGNNVIVPLDGRKPRARSFSILLPSVIVPDLNPYQRFLPAKWAFKLHGGEGELQGSAELTRDTFKAKMHLTSEDADVGVKDYRFQTNLDMLTNVNSPSLESGAIDVSGSYFKLNDATLTREDKDAAPWYAEIIVGKGVVSLNLNDAEDDVAGAKHLFQTLREKDFRTLLENADNELDISGRISDLRWLNLLLKNPYDLAIRGAGEISADVVVTSGWLNEGTNLTIKPEELIVDVLDYQARGAGGGGVELKVIRGGEFPDMTLDVAVRGAEFNRKGAEQAFVEDVDITLQALAKEMKFDGSGDNLELRLHIPSARINDMTVYNQYLPEGSPLQILDGEASLVADILLKPDDADGYVRLNTEDMHARIDDQDISAELTADIKLVDGVPRDMNFDISGSSIVLDNVKVEGDEESFRDEDWAASFVLTKGKAIWKKPVQLDLEAEVEMSDSIPLVSMMANKKGKHGWLGKAITIDDVQGDVKMQMANRQIVIPYAFAGSDKIDVGAKGIINKESRNGVLYVRFRKLHGIMKIKDGDRNIDVLKAREKFDEYSTDAIVKTGANQ